MSLLMLSKPFGTNSSTFSSEIIFANIKRFRTSQIMIIFYVSIVII